MIRRGLFLLPGWNRPFEGQDSGQRYGANSPEGWTDRGGPFPPPAVQDSSNGSSAKEDARPDSARSSGVGDIRGRSDGNASAQGALGGHIAVPVILGKPYF